MDRLVKALKKLSKEYPLENFQWDIPSNCPITIPKECNSGYLKNIYLKENFKETICNDKTLSSHYWAVQDWGCIVSFKKKDTNNIRIKNFLQELKQNSLTRNTFECISSLSKIASFINPGKYSIYDSRAIYTLNWLIFNNSSSSELFPQPIGRSAALSKYDMQTIFRLSNRQFSYRPNNVAFHEYCALLNILSPQIFGEGSKPYKLEMLLFMVAPTKIVSQIEASVSLTINA
ncbi:hypothetical protein [Limnohabitans sp. DM1]|uniref:hypothetical protein n=1 Tax=Limnohabitans sp. DM1 TaxID=1597955 RepID=UPI000A903DB7|nr:hypothetical protein [Limnohabitans sp. DM1]